MEKMISIDISEENGNVYISEDDSSGAVYPVDFSKCNAKIIEDIQKVFNTYIISYLNYESDKEKENDYEF